MAPTGYTRTQIILHWLVAIIIAGQFLFHDGIHWAMEQSIERGVYVFTTTTIGHIAGGALVLLFALWRLQLRRLRGAVPPPEGEPKPFQALSKLAHWALYALLILIPVSGSVAWWAQSEAASDAHEVLTNILMVLVLLHIGAVVVHQLVWRTGLLSRMVRPGA